MHGIVCDMETRKPEGNLEDVSRLEDLPGLFS